MSKVLHTTFTAILLLYSFISPAQDKRAQYPALLTNSYFGVDIGYIDYRFSQKQLEPGYTASSVRIPHAAVSVFFGHQFNKYLSAQLSYMRPVAFVEYMNVNGGGHNYEVGMNVAGLSLKPCLPISKNVSLNGEAGIALITRGGFIVVDRPGVKDASYAGLLLGAGLKYQLNSKWELSINSLWASSSDKLRQPSTFFASAGFNYVMRSLPKEIVAKNADTGHVFPRHSIGLAFTTSALGYGINNFVSKDAHIFWGGAARVRQGFSINYRSNLFHTRKVFSLDWGAGVAWWKSNPGNETFYTLSIYPAFRFTFARTKPLDIYFDYSFAGPSFISRTTIEGKDMGGKFTFQDFMGIGIVAGRQRNLEAGIRIAHYSNGNIFPQ
ncbi:MAG TPA: acyloxyacyl hydrolase, partial [Chitinophagaceae bacterium]|nr:acyloxyacyl hydrolase [Chitinophagaceae bacterium]